MSAHRSTHTFVWLDIARALAATIVLGGHLRAFILTDFVSSGHLNVFWKAFYFITSMQHQAVIVFFVLSGFLIGMTVSEQARAGRWSWNAYAIKRTSRLWLVLLPALALTALWDQLGIHLTGSPLYSGGLEAVNHSTPVGPLNFSLLTGFANALFLQTLSIGPFGTIAPPFGTITPLWSLAIEFWYYVVFPLIFFALARTGRHSISVRLVLLGLAVLLCVGALSSQVLLGVVWLLGYLAYEAHRYLSDNAAKLRLPLAVASFVIFAVTVIVTKARNLEGFRLDFLVGISFALLIVFVAGFNLTPAATRVARFFAGFSYTLYLVHFPILAFVTSVALHNERFTPGPKSLLIFGILFVSVIAYAYVVSLAFEAQTPLVQRLLLRSARGPTSPKPALRIAAERQRVESLHGTQSTGAPRSTTPAQHAHGSGVAQRIRQLTRTILRIATARSGAAAVSKSFVIRVGLLALNFATGVLVARSLGPAGRGEQAAIAMWPGFLATFATIGVPTALTFHSRRSPQEAKRLYMASAITMLVFGLVATAVGAACLPLLLHGYDANTIRTAQWFMLFAPEPLVAAVAWAHLDSRDMFTRSVLGMFYSNAATLAALVAFRLANELTPVTAALSYIVPPAIQALWIISRLWHWPEFSIRRIFPDMRKILPYGLQCYGIDVVKAVSSQLDLVMIVAFLSTTELGLYTVALSLSRVLNVVQSSVATIVFSRASSLNSDEAIDLISRAARLATLACIALAIFLIVVAEFAVPLVYGAAFSAAIPIFGVLTIETVLGCLVIVLFQSFMATGRPGVVTLIEACWAGTVVALLFILVPRMNLIGAATALLGAAVVRAGLCLAAYPFALKRPVPQLILNRDDVRFVANSLGRLLTPRREAVLVESKASQAS
jgi:peptidoglycan/LPS O-acetylase OafA/YrhL/O-antigen/teichoic acid export membrane protein